MNVLQFCFGYPLLPGTDEVCVYTFQVKWNMASQLLVLKQVQKNRSNRVGFDRDFVGNTLDFRVLWSTSHTAHACSFCCVCTKYKQRNVMRQLTAEKNAGLRRCRCQHICKVVSK